MQGKQPSQGQLSTHHTRKTGTVAFLGWPQTTSPGSSPENLVHLYIRSPATAFTLPKEIESTPIIMVAAGTGIAPFRGFVQERFLQISGGQHLAPAVLFFECRSPQVDDLYREEFDLWEAAGAVTVHRAYSKPPAGEGLYVQGMLAQHSQEVKNLWAQGARCYVCGGARMAEGVRQSFEKIVGKLDGDGVEQGRYLTEIFS